MTHNILLTGATGVLGTVLARRLARQGHTVTGLDLRPWPEAPAGVRHLTGDIRDRKLLDSLMKGQDAVVHCASALPSYPDRTIRSVVVDGTRSVAGAAAASGVRRLVYVSSTSVYGLPDVVPTPESHPVAPQDAYGWAKVAAESACAAVAGDELSVTVLRPKTFIGPGRLGLFSLLFEWAAAGHNFPVLGSGDVIAQLCATEDVAAAAELALAAPQEAANGVYNIASAEFGSLREDFQAVLDAAGHGKRVVSVPMGPTVPILQALAHLRLSPVYRRLVHKLRSDSYVSIDKARTELGYRPRLSSQEAILSAFSWWLEHQEDGELRRPGNASNNRWRQGALGLARVLF